MSDYEAVVRRAVETYRMMRAHGEDCSVAYDAATATLPVQGYVASVMMRDVCKQAAQSETAHTQAMAPVVE